MVSTRLSTAVAVAALLALSAVPLASAGDKSWRFDVDSKQAALGQAQSRGVGFTKEGKEDPAKLKDMFEDWAQEFELVFASQREEQTAFKNFKANMAQVSAVNLDASRPFWMSGNAFSHLSYEDFSATILMDADKVGPRPASDAATPTAPLPLKSRKLLQAALPDAVNWVTAGKVTPVRNQGSCGSCWAFAATSVIESAYLMKVGGSASTLNLSEQQLISCVNPTYSAYNGYGCSGGWVDNAMNYVFAVNQTTEARYPYASTTGTCNLSIVTGSAAGQAVKLGGTATKVLAQDEAALKTAVSTAPTAILFMVDSTFQSYAGGVYTPTTCTSGVNHAMVATGYNSTGAYWNIRNSWGATWGEQGYARVQMTGNGLGPCGMYQWSYQAYPGFTSSPLVEGSNTNVIIVKPTKKGRGLRGI